MPINKFPSTGGADNITASSPLQRSADDIQVISKATMLSYLNVEDGADVTDSSAIIAAGGVTTSATQTLTNKNYEHSLNTQTGASYTAVLSDNGKVITMSNGSGNTFTIPSNSSVAYPVGTTLTIIQLGAGQTTIAINTDTLNTNNGTKISGQYGVATAIKVTSTSWVLMGDLTT